jgi:nucleoporin GLE1
MHTALCQHLPAAPSLSNPLPLESASRPYLYLLSHMSKAILKQAESEVSAKPDAAYPLARVVVLLLLQGHTAFGEILFARFVKKCPWVVPFYPSRAPDQPRDEYEKSTGRGSDESAADYIGRMNGILTLYLAIVQTPLDSLFSAMNVTPTPEQLVNVITPPMRFTASWSWIAHALRDPLPTLAPTATLITTWIEITGAEMIRVYGRGQVMKIFQAIKEEGVDQGKIKGDSESARNQLRMMLEQVDRLSHPAAREWN